MNAERMQSLLQMPEVIELMKTFDFELLDEEQMDVILDYLLTNISV